MANIIKAKTLIDEDTSEQTNVLIEFSNGKISFVPMAVEG